jgi:hypothetical protein
MDAPPDRITDPAQGIRYRRWYEAASREYDRTVRFSDRTIADRDAAAARLAEATRAELPGLPWCELAAAAVEDVLARRQPRW